jgi:hypothetical protein
MEAQQRFSCGFFSKSVFPVFASTSTAEGAFTSSFVSADALTGRHEIVSKTASEKAAAFLSFKTSTPKNKDGVSPLFRFGQRAPFIKSYADPGRSIH